MQINRENVKWLGRMMVILLAVAVVDGLVAAFARRPLPWVAIIPGLIPLLTIVLVVLPRMKTETLDPPERLN